MKHQLSEHQLAEMRKPTKASQKTRWSGDEDAAYHPVCGKGRPGDAMGRNACAMPQAIGAPWNRPKVVSWVDMIYGREKGG